MTGLAQRRKRRIGHARTSQDKNKIVQRRECYANTRTRRHAQAAADNWAKAKSGRMGFFICRGGIDSLDELLPYSEGYFSFDADRRRSAHELFRAFMA